MNNRISYIFAVILAVSFLLCNLTGCANENENVSKSAEFKESDFMKAEGFTVDNDTSLDTLLTEEYAIEELNAFFGDNVCLGDRLMGCTNTEKKYTWEEVNARFPVQCLRYYDGVHYSVYKVKNGKYYYVFWQVPVVTVPNGRTDPQDEWEIFAAESVYFQQLPSIFSFWGIWAGHSTAKDIAEIDPAMDLELMTAITRSYSLLKDGRVLEVRYSYSKLESLEDLIVTGTSIFSREDACTNLAAIRPDDFFKDSGRFA